MSSSVQGESHSVATASHGRIRPPTTTDDDGNPTESITVDVERIFRLIEDERHLSAQALFHSVNDRLHPTDEKSPTNNSTGGKSTKKFLFRPLLNRRLHGDHRKVKSSTQKDIVKAREMMEANKGVLEKLEERCQLFAIARKNLDSDADWTLAQTLFGVTTFYRREPDGSLSIKLEGKLKDVPLFDQVAVLREIDLHYCWAPFCSSSLTISHLDKLDTVGWFVVGLPQFGLMRDGCFRAVGCDSIYEDGSVLLVAHGINDRPENGADNKHLEPGTISPISGVTSGTTSTASSSRRGSHRSNDSKRSHQADVALEAYEEDIKIFEVLSNDPILKTLDIPSPPTHRGSGRMTIKTFQALIHIESPTLATTKLVTNIDPNLPLVPQSLIDFFMKRLCGVLLNKLQAAAKKVSKNPVTNPHAIKMREEEDFYKGWLMEKFKGVCKLRGWEMTPFSAFELSDAQLDLANEYVAKRKSKSLQHAVKFYHTMSDERLEEYLESPHNGTASEPSSVCHADNNMGGPAVRAVNTENDEMSELSKNSSSISTFWTNTPIVSYLREIEERTQLQKLREIEKSRERAANRLKPKVLDDDSRSRLDELRAVRARVRTSGVTAANKVGPALMPNTATQSPRDHQQRHAEGWDVQRDWAVFWTKHGWFTRLVVIHSLMALLFSLLYMNKSFEEFVQSREDTFWTGRERDFAALAYIGITGWVHFLLCYVGLMYAFSSLKVGTIAGKQAKKFYSQNVHLIVGLASLGLVVVGVIKPGVVKSMQWMAWKSHVLYVTAGKLPTSPLPTLPSAIVIPFQVLYHATLTVLAWVKSLLLESTIVGRSIIVGYNFLAGYFLSCYQAWNGFIEESVNVYTGGTESIPWRADAFVTTRTLLAYSASFLLVLLLAFHVVARNSRSSEPGTRQNPIDDQASVGSAKSGNSSTRSGHLSNSDLQANGGNNNVTASASTSALSAEATGSNSTSRKQSSHHRSVSPAFHTIDENQEMVDVDTQRSSLLGGSSKNKKSLRGGLRLRRGSRAASM